MIAHMNSENVLNTYLDCSNLLAAIGNFKWASNVEFVLRELLDASQNYMSDHFANLIASDSFLSLGHSNSWNISRLENLLLKIASTLTPDQACKSYQRCTRLNTVLQSKIYNIPGTTTLINDEHEDMDWNGEFIRLVSALLSAVEQCLTRQCARAMKVSAWQRIDGDLRKKIQQLACLSGPIDRKPRSSTRLSANHNTPYQNRIQDLNQLKLAFQAHNAHRSGSNDRKSYIPNTYTQTNVFDRITVRPVTDKYTTANKSFKQQDTKSDSIMKSVSKTRIPTSKGILDSSVHQRSKSETINPLEKTASTNSVAKLANVKSRYLSVKKPLLKDSTERLDLKSKKLSSSENSSRTNSPANRKSCNKKATNDSNCLTDSLESSTRSTNVRSSKNEIYSSIGSLYSQNSQIKKLNDEFNKSHENLKDKNLIKDIKVKGRYSSSIVQPKINSIRQNKSLVENTPQTKRSFLSAKSREILAKKNAKQQISSAPTTAVAKSSSESPINSEKHGINKSYSSSSVVNRRLTSQNSNTKTQKQKSVMDSKTKLIPKKTTASVKKENVTKNDDDSGDVNELDKCMMKMERSSTFCKEFSDIPAKDLQIIE